MKVKWTRRRKLCVTRNREVFRDALSGVADGDELLSLMDHIARVFRAYHSDDALVSCQGQAMDGYSALANYDSCAEDITSFIDTFDES